ncbi:MAG: hypothetical protein JOY61_09100 [Chloroflexi bacterium]|nr:hypothetical protein [Chloroflexota bacterium]
MTLFAWPSALRASAIHLAGDRWIADGIHLRVTVVGELGFPLHPFIALRLLDFQAEPVTVNWVGTDGQRLVEPFSIASAGGQARGVVLGRSGALNPAEWLFVEVSGDGDLKVEALDPFGQRAVATRIGSPYRLTGSSLSQLRVSGSGRINSVQALHADRVAPRVPGAVQNVETTFGLPLAGSPWYASSPQPLDDAKQRLLLGRSVRFGPPDRPDGSFDLLPPDADVHLVLGHWGPERVDDWLKAGFLDPQTPPPATRRTESDAHVPPRSVSLNVTDGLLIMGADPRLARYLGLGTAFSPAPSVLNVPFGVWVVAAQWAVQAARLPVDGPPVALLVRDGQAPPELQALLDARFPELPTVRGHFNALNAALRPTEQWSFVTLMAAAVAAVNAPSEPPDAPSLGQGLGSWTARGPADPETWTQHVLLETATIGPIAFARTRPDGPSSLHRKEPPNDPAGRAVGLLPARRTNGPTALVDTAVPVDPAGGAWRIWASDEFGRWGPASADLAAPLPERPPPPPPLLELVFSPAAAVADPAPRSPGTLTVRVSLPDPGRLPPGAGPLAQLVVSVDGVAQPAVALAPGAAAAPPVQVAAPVGPFAVGEQRLVQVSATFADVDGRVSPPGAASRIVTDPRAYPVAKTGPRLIWTGRPDATGRAELGLQWPATGSQAQYRVYLGDERVLAAALGIGVDPTTPRAERARVIWQRRIELTDKSRFTLITSEPIAPSADRVVRFQHQWPGTLRGVQFLRVVPVSASQAAPGLPVGEVEAAFEECSLVPVAIPTTDRPPAPTLRARFDSATGAQITVEARGLRDDILAERSFPATGFKPECRLRQTRARLAEPLYMPVIATALLTEPAAGSDMWTHVHVKPPDGMPAFVRHMWVAEVRYPAEPSLAPGVNDVPSEVSSLFPQPQDAEGEWSAASLPASTVAIPAVAPAAVAGATARRLPPTGVFVTPRVELTVPIPGFDARTVAPWRVAVYTHAGANPPSLAGEPQDAPGPVFTTFFAPPLPDKLDVALVDPVGRQGQTVSIAVDPGPP